MSGTNESILKLIETIKQICNLTESNLINFRTGEVAATKEQAQSGDFQYVSPENVGATVADIMGVDRNQFGNIKPDVPSLPLTMK